MARTVHTVFLLHYPSGVGSPYVIYAGPEKEIRPLFPILSDRDGYIPMIIDRPTAVRMGWTVPRTASRLGDESPGGFAHLDREAETLPAAINGARVVVRRILQDAGIKVSKLGPGRMKAVDPITRVSFLFNKRPSERSVPER